MKPHPVTILDPVFRWLDWLIAEHGHYIYLVMVWASPFLIAWVLRGGFWRRPPRRRRVVKAPPVISQTKATPPPLPSIIGERRERRKWPSDDDDGNTQAFAA